MKKIYKIEVDCANCANLMEEAIKKTFGVKDAAINFMAQKAEIEFQDDVKTEEVIKEIIKNCKKVDEDSEIFLN